MGGGGRHSAIDAFGCDQDRAEEFVLPGCSFKTLANILRGVDGREPIECYNSVHLKLLNSVTVLNKPRTIRISGSKVTCEGEDYLGHAICGASATCSHWRALVEIFCHPDADENFKQYYSVATSPALEIEVVGADHMDFLDNPNCGFAYNACGPGTADAAEVRSMTQGYITAFFDVSLKGNNAQESWLSGPEMDMDESAGVVTSQSKNGF